MSAERKMDSSPVELLDAIKRQGKEWDVLAPQYGVTNPDPPWKSSLTGTSADRFHLLTDAKLRMSSQTPSTKGFLRRNAICSP